MGAGPTDRPGPNRSPARPIRDAYGRPLDGQRTRFPLPTVFFPRDLAAGPRAIRVIGWSLSWTDAGDHFALPAVTDGSLFEASDPASTPDHPKLRTKR